MCPRRAPNTPTVLCENQYLILSDRVGTYHRTAQCHHTRRCELGADQAPHVLACRRAWMATISHRAHTGRPEKYRGQALFRVSPLGLRPTHHLGGQLIYIFAFQTTAALVGFQRGACQRSQLDV